MASATLTVDPTLGFRAIVQFHRDGAMVFRVPPDVTAEMASVGEEI
jgi:hypothetical protein